MAILATESPTFQLAMRIVNNITQANPAVVTTSFDHDYVTGAIVRLYVPLGYGMVQANEKKGAITVLTPTTFEINLDTTQFDPFAAPSSSPEDKQFSQVVPVGEINSILTAATQNVL